MKRDSVFSKVRRALSRCRRAHALLLVFILCQASRITQAADTDQDGLDDGLEQKLLERYRPFFAFAENETFRPTDVQFYLQNSELLASGDEDSSPIIPNSVLKASPAAALGANQEGDAYCSNTGPGSGPQHTCVSDLTLNRRQTNYRINPLEHPPGASSDNPGRRGADWAQVTAQRNIGLYGHVVPIHLSAPTWGCQTRWDTVDRSLKAPRYYKVEYWQFFGYNSQDKPANIGDHEGDWTTLQLLIKPACSIKPPQGE